MQQTNIHAQLKRLHSPEAHSLEEFRPNGPFGILVQAIVGTVGTVGEESFDFMLCTPEWFDSNMSGQIALGRHYLFVREFDFEKLTKFVSDYCFSCTGSSWQSVAEKVGRLGKWEFEDYVA